DGKWPDYLEFCDRFYWGLPPELDRACLEGPDFRPDCCGVIVADEYDAEIVRPAPSQPLASARRNAETERLARAARRRLAVGAEPAARLRPPQGRDRTPRPRRAAATDRRGRSRMRRLGARGWLTIRPLEVLRPRLPRTALRPAVRKPGRCGRRASGWGRACRP